MAGRCLAVVYKLSKVVSIVDLFSKCAGALTFENFRQSAGTCRGSVLGDPISCLSRCTSWSRSKRSRFYKFFLSFFINCGCPGRETERQTEREGKFIENGTSVLTVLPQRGLRRRVYSQQKQSTRWSLSATVRREAKKYILAMSF
jgi:hypothetical protein